MRNKPTLEPHLVPIRRAFRATSTDRQIGFGGAGPIPFSSLDRYAARYGIEDIDEFDRFIALIWAMDGAFLDHMNRKRERAG